MGGYLFRLCICLAVARCSIPDWSCKLSWPPRKFWLLRKGGGGVEIFADGNETGYTLVDTSFPLTC